MAAAPNSVKMRDVSSRWTPNLAVGGWTPVCDIFLDNYKKLGITNLEAMFVIHLIRFKWTSDMPFPGFKRIAGKMGITPTAARAHARSLEKKGLVKRIERSGSSNRFDLTELFQWLERLQLEQSQPNPELDQLLDQLVNQQVETPMGEGAVV